MLIFSHPWEERADLNTKSDPTEGQPSLSRRERQILDVVYRLRSASAADVQAGLTDPPSYSSVRTLLGILAEKGHVRYRIEGAKYVYEPVVPKEEMARSVLRDVMATFFEGSVERAVSTLIDSQEADLSPKQIAAIREIIDEARRRGR